MDFTPNWYLAAKRGQCCGDCEQGRKQCASPQACAQPEDDFGDGGAIGAITKLWPALITAWALIAAIAGFFWIVAP